MEVPFKARIENRTGCTNVVYWFADQVTWAIEHRSTSFRRRGGPAVYSRVSKKRMAFTRLSEEELAEFLTKTKRKEINTKTRRTYCSMDVIYFLGSICKKNLCLYPETVQNTGQQKSLRGSKLVPIFGVNNKTIIEFGLRRMWRIMQNIIQPPSIIAK